MTQIIVTLDHQADSSFLRKAIENMKGVLKTTIKSTKSVETDNISAKDKVWIDKLHAMRDMINHVDIDYDDEKLKYLLSK